MWSSPWQRSVVQLLSEPYLTRNVRTRKTNHVWLRHGSGPQPWICLWKETEITSKYQLVVMVNQYLPVVKNVIRVSALSSLLVPQLHRSVWFVFTNGDRIMKFCRMVCWGNYTCPKRNTSYRAVAVCNLPEINVESIVSSSTWNTTINQEQR